MTMLITRIFFLSAILAFGCSVKKTPATTTTQHISLNIKAEPSPIDLTGLNVTFYKSIRYGDFSENDFDIFIPESTSKTPLVIYIHGGAGNKTTPYTEGAGAKTIKAFLSGNVAYASINYRMLEKVDRDGVLKCMNDSKRALQFIRYHADLFNVNKDKVVLMGSSLGGGTSLWIGFHDNMADPLNSDPVLRESTRVQGVIAVETQANYDILEWHNNVFAEYQAEGMDQNYVRSLGTEDKLYSFLGVDRSTDLYSEESKKQRNDLNMLLMMSSDDPEIYIVNARFPYAKPTRTGELTHHPLHAKALMERAIETGLNGKFYIPKMQIDTRDGESFDDFVLRVVER